MAEGQLPVDALTSDGKSALDKGRVIVIDNQVDQTTGTVKLKAEFPNDNLQLWPGQFVNVRVLIDTLRQVVVVPTAAIQRGPNGTFVYVLKEGNTVTVRRVTLTQQDDARAVVATGLQAGEQLVTTGFAPSPKARRWRYRARRMQARSRPTRGCARMERGARAAARERKAVRARPSTHERVLAVHLPPDRDVAT
jgi:multidrug efflux pump subunit AcrA (membrane-fusion protein)